MSVVSPRVYLDHAATAPMLDAARDAWLDASRAVGNPSSLHTSGRAARRIVEEARELIASKLRVRPGEIVFTSGGTEADNLAIKGMYWASKQRGIACSATEHHAVLDPVHWLTEHDGAEVSWLEVDELGRVRLDAFATLLAERAEELALVSVMWANNEIGTIQPIADLAAMCRERDVAFHTDAVQALGMVPLDLEGIDAITISSHKIGGPFGVGALILDRGRKVTPVLHGGGQERDVRSGTLDAPAIAAFAVAVEHAVDHQSQHAEEVSALRDALIEGVREAVPSAVLNGDRVDRLPGNVHFSFPGCEGDALLMLLDAAGIDCSTGSACTAGIPEPSHVLLAIGVPEERARGSLRFSLGRTSTQTDVDALVAALPSAVERASRAGSARR